MTTKQSLRAMTCMIALILTAGTARALEVTATIVSLPVPDSVAEANTLVGTLAGPGSTAQLQGISNARSPWTGQTAAAAGDRKFLFVSAGGSITYELTAAANGGVPAAKATLLWGSPDDYNKLQLFRNGDVVATIIPGAGAVPANASNTYSVTITGVVFDEAVFSATGTSFEFANFAIEPEFTGQLACGDTEAAPGVTLRRLNDVGVTNPADCAPPIPSRLDFDGTTLTFLANYGLLGSVQPAFAFDVAWRTEWVDDVPSPSAIPYTTGAPNPPTGAATLSQAAPLSVQWFGLSALPVDPYLLDYCPGTATFAPEPDANGNPVLLALAFPTGFNDLPDGPNDMSAALDGFQFGCLVSRVVELVSDASACPGPAPTPNAVCARVKEAGYLRGDWTATRQLR